MASMTAIFYAATLDAFMLILLLLRHVARGDLGDKSHLMENFPQFAMDFRKKSQKSPQNFFIRKS